MKVLLIEDQSLLSGTLKEVLENTGDIEIIGQSDKACDAPGLCERLKPELVIMDIITNDGNGIDYTAIIKNRFPDIKVMILTGMADDYHVQAASDAGADLFARKDITLNDLIELIHYAKKPYRVFPSVNMPAKEYINLSAVDIEIIRLLAAGNSSKEIADVLYLSYGTVRIYVSNMYALTGCKSRAQLIAYAIRHGLIEGV